jgi:hypothetical protein
MSIRIEMKELQLIIRALLENARKENINFMNIDIDYYWQIDVDDWEDFSSSSAPEPGVNSLIDDWHFLQYILDDDERTMVIFDYERLASIMRLLGQTIRNLNKNNQEFNQ